ncbi:hypothetical protein BaRGS_00007319 [Batillaria attramentaria]|uniref:Uncharacterized protein n=1 Tax=Batillaria attramentaria TaxID=370345 RepID=A0ABD0LPN9_9CAEN
MREPGIGGEDYGGEATGQLVDADPRGKDYEGKASRTGGRSTGQLVDPDSYRVSLLSLVVYNGIRNISTPVVEAQNNNSFGLKLHFWNCNGALLRFSRLKP